MDEKFKITFSGMEPTESLKDYALEKFGKHEHLLELILSADIIMIENTGRKGVDKDFELSVTASVPRTRVHVDDRGEDMYALIDTVSEKFYRLLQRYRDRLDEWQGAKPWQELEELTNGFKQETTFTAYKPKILVRRRMLDLSPMTEAEAIENMELQGWDQYMFKNGKNGRLAVVYKVNDNYGIIEEPNNVIG